MSALPDLALVTAVAVALLWGCGLLLAPLLPRRLRPLLPLVAPFLGFALISALGHYAGVAGASLRDVRWLFVGLAGAGWAVVLLGRRWRRPPRSAMPALAVCLLAFFLAVSPLLFLGYLTTIGATIDGISYAVRSEYLQDAPLRLPEIAAGKPYLGWVLVHIQLLRAGDVYFVGLLGLLTGRRSYELLSVVPALFFALTAGAVFVWARVSLRLRRAGALLAACLVGINNLVLFPVYDNFLSQTIALSFIPLALCLGVEAQRRPEWRMAVLFGILMTGLASTYPVYAFYSLAAVLFFWGVTWILRPGGPRGRALESAILWWVGTLAVAAVWNGVALARAGKELGMVSGLLAPEGAKYVGPGNILVFPPVIEVLGLISHVGAAYYGAPWPHVPMTVLTALGLGFFALAAYGWWRLAPRARIAAAAALLVGIALVAQQRWGVNLPHGYPYGWFKMISGVTPQVLVLVAAGIAALWRSLARSARPWSRWLATGAALLLLAVNAKHTLWTISYVAKDRLVVDRELIEAARSAARLKDEDWLLLDLSPSLRQHWLGVLLRDEKIRYREPLVMSHVDTPGAANAFFKYAIVEKVLDGQRQEASLDEPWYVPAGYSRLWSNDRYELRMRLDSTLFSLRWQKPWPEAAVLELGLAGDRNLLTARLGTEAREAPMSAGTPRTVQVRVFSLSDDARLPIAGVADPVPLPAGGWLVDLDLSCFGGGVAVGPGTGEAILSDVQVLGAVTGKPGVCVETSALPVGAAYLEQEDLGGDRVRFEAVLLQPANAGQRLYRLGIHVIDPAQQKLFGVWSLDFAAGDRLQRGILEIDLGDRSSRAEVDGVSATPIASNLDTAAGSFEADAVWWQLNPIEQLQVEPMLWFQRGGDGAVQVTRSVPAARLKVIPPP